MPWKEQSKVDQRREFARLATGVDANMSQLCQRFEISRKTGYKWLARYRRLGDAGLEEQSRRPQQTPGRTQPNMERAVLAVRDKHRKWSGRKIRRRLQDLGKIAVPAASTIGEILRRHGRLDEAAGSQHRPWQRFTHPHPNDLWQMDFKGHFGLGDGGRCHPLTVLDDHSRYVVGLRACANEQGQTVRAELIMIFRRYGLPLAMLMDNGSPWGAQDRGCYTQFSVWLMRLAIRVMHGRPYHPQTQGKDERFHRTLNEELLQLMVLRNYDRAQRSFDHFRFSYNHERPHEALQLAVPATRYASSGRDYPEQLAAIEYPDSLAVRKVCAGGWIYYGGRQYRISKAFVGYPIGLRQTNVDGVLDVYFCRYRVAQINQRNPSVDG